jgi:Flp pilus assembly protein TadD
MAESARLDELQRKYAENPRRYFAPLANEYRKAGELSTAVAICRDELARFPGHMSGHVVLGQALYESRRASEAQASFERALELDPENLIALRHLGDIARDRGDLKEARSWYERVLEADPRNDDIAAQLSRLAPSYGRSTQAPAYAPPSPAAVAPPLPPAASEPLLEPLEWTALDLGTSGQPMPDAEPQAVAAPVPGAAPLEAPADGLLDYEPAELTPQAADAAPAADGPTDAPALRAAFSVISDEVSAIADDHGLVEPPESRSRHEAPPEAPARVVPAPPSEAPLVLEGDQRGFVMQEPQGASAVRWDDFLPSLELDADEPAGALAAPADLALTGSPSVAAPDESEAPHALEAPQDGERAPEIVDELWQFSVDAAEDVALAPLALAGPTAGADAVPPPTAEIGIVALDDAASSAPTFGEQAAMPIGAPADAAVEAHSQPTAHDAPAPSGVVPEAAVDVYDFLVPFEERAAPAASSEDAGAVPDGGAPAHPHDEPAAEERGPALELPFEAALLDPDGANESGETTGDAAPFASTSGSAYEPVVGLDAPPARSIPAVLAAAAAELDSEDGASPAPAGAFVTETMAQLLSEQGHLEQALDVYAQLEAHRPDDPELRARAGALRARLAPSAPAQSTPGEVPSAETALPTAGAFFASLALDGPAAEAPAAPLASVPSPGFFDGPAGELDERAAMRLARAFGSHDAATSSLVSAIFDAPPASPPPTVVAAEPVAAGPATAPPAPALTDAPYGLGEFSFERFFAGLEEDAPPSASPPMPDEGRIPHSLAGQPATDDPWPELPAPVPHAAAPSASDDRASAPDVAPPVPAVSDDDDLAQFNAWLKGLLEP